MKIGFKIRIGNVSKYVLIRDNEVVSVVEVKGHIVALPI